MSNTDFWGPKSLGEAFDPRRNSLNAIRLILAALVIVSHSWPIGGYGDDPVFGDQKLGSWAVAGFFCISGFLITQSRERSATLGDFVWRRVLRIYPAFITSLVIVAFLIAPSVIALTHRGGTWSAPSAAAFVYDNVFLYMRNYGIEGTLHSSPHADVWNGALWTLFYEFACYIGVGAMVSLVRAHWRRTVVVAIVIVCAALTLAHNSGIVELPGFAVVLARLGGFFAGGAAIYMYRDQVPANWRLGALAALAVVALGWLGLSEALAALPLAYFLLFAGVRLPLRTVGAKNDVSYGLYIYGFPIQQALVLAIPAQSVPPLAFAAIAVAGTLPFAWGSWLLVERPLMKYKTLLGRLPRATQGERRTRGAAVGIEKD